MPDREKVIYGLYTAIGALRALKNKFPKTEEDVEPGIQACTEAVELLKEQEAVKPVRDKKTGRMWLCGNCGSYVGFEDHDEDDPNEFDKYCRECGRPVLWEGR